MPVDIPHGAYWLVQEIADELCVRYQYVYRHVRNGELPAVSYRHLVLVRDEDARQYIKIHQLGRWRSGTG